MYTTLRLPRSEFIPVRGLAYHVRVWGDISPARSPIVMLHGWMDVSASFQFVVDALTGGRAVVAPDWRGFGLTDARGADNFWFPDYLADLDALLDHYMPGQAADVVAHSMGGNIAMLYAGARPQRIGRLVNLEGFGMPQTEPGQAPDRYAKWMDEIKALARGEMDLQTYPDSSGVARRLMRTNPRLTHDKADWLATHWAAAQTRADGSTAWAILGNPAHKLVNANLYRVEETLALYRRITASVLAIEAADGIVQTWQKRGHPDDLLDRLKVVPRMRIERIEDAGHMLHHDQPERVAAIIAGFFA